MSSEASPTGNGMTFLVMPFPVQYSIYKSNTSPKEIPAKQRTAFSSQPFALGDFGRSADVGLTLTRDRGLTSAAFRICSLDRWV